MSESNNHIKSTQKWLKQVVIDLGLCPFANLPFINNQIRYVVCEAVGQEQQLAAFWNEVETIKNSEASIIATTLIIFPSQLTNFQNYLDFFGLAETLLDDQGELENFQLASFHPNYQFAGTTPDDVSNYTNRSPFPIVHILRADELESAIAAHPDTAEIPDRNIAWMEEMGLESVLNLFAKLNG